MRALDTQDKLSALFPRRGILVEQRATGATVEVERERFSGLAPEQNDAVFVAFPAKHDNASSRKVHIFKTKLRNLAHAATGCVQKFKHGTIAR